MSTETLPEEVIRIAKVLLVEILRVHGRLVGDLLAVGHTLLGAFFII